MHVLKHPLVAAFGLANFYLLLVNAPLISTAHDLVYHMDGSATPLFVTALLYLLLVWILFYGLLRLAQRDNRLSVAILTGLLCWLPLVFAKSMCAFLGTTLRHWASVSLFLAGGILWFAIVLLWRPAYTKTLQAGRTRASEFAGILALSGLIYASQIAWCGWEARALNTARPLHAQANTASRAHASRIIWIVLDELSYQQVYEQRFPGLTLPEFDALAAQSTVFTRMRPAARYTEFALPSFITGQRVIAVRTSASGNLLSMKDPATGRWNRFDVRQTVFQDALNNGYGTAIAGWFNPYCRILPEVLEHCYWAYNQTRLSQSEAIKVYLLEPLNYLMRGVFPNIFPKRWKATDAPEDVQIHTADYKLLTEHGDAYLSDLSINFLLLHLPIPHPNGIYDRRTKTFATHLTSYVDNLALADLYLAHVREVLEEQHAWDSTTLVVMGDHAWRTYLWRRDGTWTAEDEAASHGGQYDERPAYLVKLPNQQEGARIDEPFQAVRTRALMDALMTTQIRTADDLRAWVDKKQ